MIGSLLIYALMTKISIPFMFNDLLVNKRRDTRKQHMCHMLHEIKKSLLKLFRVLY